MHFLITAGGTREYIDPVRFITNASSGKMGYALTQAALKAGHKVTLITTVGNSKFKNQNSKIKIIKVETAAQMFDAVKRHLQRCDCLIMAAAVADYTPIRPAKAKIKRTNKPIIIKLKPTVDILKWAGEHKNDLRTTRQKPRIIVGFALEEKNLRANAEKKLAEKHLDMIIVNTPCAIGAEKSTVHIKRADCSWIKIENASKITIAKKIIDLLIHLRQGCCG